MSRWIAYINDPRNHVKFNKIMLVAWMILLIPTLLWWQESIVWIVFMSWYANTVGHWSAYTSAKTEEKVENGE